MINSDRDVWNKKCYIWIHERTYEQMCVGCSIYWRIVNMQIYKWAYTQSTYVDEQQNNLQMIGI